MSNQFFQFVSLPPHILTPEIEKQITDAKAWVHITPTENIKPAINAGAFIPDSFVALKKKIDTLEDMLKKEMKRREESDLILAHQIAQIKNKDITIQRIEDAHSILYYCAVCFENHRNTRFSPCGHVVCCAECANQLFSSQDPQQRRCPICRSVLTRTEIALIV